MKEAGMTWEEFPDAQEWQKNGWAWSWLKRGKRAETSKPPEICSCQDIENLTPAEPENKSAPT